MITSEMANEQETNKLIQEMMKQMTTFQEKVEAIQKNPSTKSKGDSDDEMKVGTDGLMELSETTKVFLEAAFTATMSNKDHKKRIGRIGVPNCDQIRCPKLDGVLKAVLPKDAIKADGSTAILARHSGPLMAVLESADAGELTPEKAVAATQTALYLMGNVHQQMAQERRKKLILKLNPSSEVYG